MHKRHDTAEHQSILHRVKGYLNDVNRWSHRRSREIRDVVLRISISTVVLSLAVPFATQVYALRFGARLPLEGVPYSFVFVLAASLVITASTMFGYLMPLLQNRLHKIVHDNSSFGERLRKLTIRIMRISLPVISVLAGIVISFLMAAAFEPELILPNLLAFDFESAIPLLALLMALIQFVFGTIITLERRSLRNLSFFSWNMYTAALITTVFILFTDAFAYGLRAVQFGGGRKVAVETVDGTKVSDVYLFIHSTDSLTVWNDDAQQFEEFNLEHIVAVDYKPDDMWRLPPNRKLR